MKFDTPATTNPIDRLKVVGKATSRIDGPLKITGAATYAYEHHEAAPNQAYGHIIGSAIAKGRIERIDLKDALRAPGVLGIVTHENSGPIGSKKTTVRTRVLAGPEVTHYHQAVALVVAESFEEARAAAALVRISYARADGRFDLAEAKDGAPLATPYRGPPETRIGDFEGAFAAAPVQLDESYSTPDQTHAMMEPHATIAVWDGDRLTCWTSLQLIANGVEDMALTLGISKENIRMVSSFIGGGFGGKAFILSDNVLAALGARLVGRPVKVAMQRALMFNNTTHRSATIQRIRIGAGSDGRITALGHEGWCYNVPDGLPESAPQPTKSMYAGANRLTRSRMALLDLPESGQLRAPCETPGMMALECAMDEMAEKVGLDPVEFRILNDAKSSPEHPGRPFSRRQLVECLRTGAERFGWDRRDPRPGARREGRWLVGMGVAGAIRGSIVFPAGARVRLDRHGIVTVETDMTDLGTGTYTIVAQTAAEMMGTSLNKVVVRLGDSRFPVGPGAAGQAGAASTTAAVYAACVKLRETVAQRLGFNNDEVDFAGGRVRLGNKSIALGKAAADGDIVAEDRMEYGDLAKRYDMQTFGANFTEIGVDCLTGEIRVRRMLMVCAAGRIINPKAARSQIIGGMTMGVGAALMEHMVTDTRFGYFVNHDLAGYEVPVHADIPHQEVIFLEEVDPMATPLKMKGVGELGITGTAPSIANAVYNAIGVRVRDYPITLDKYLDRLPALT
ncbi:aldehyde oxidoreductase molybdenum-binding subunit PaoC [Rhizorhabdus sp.]|uniref:aldehyde oxidoreductase molybdenum-binding subunit PaoC n=1 Tax=Rhizorhabdus sp. TaxID=1968843 RepID=UPI0019925B6F|nr:aldehyde oxidoreductase molybdenum-binding subunit PaoC [Rhizorhabdus sp.]MBD3759648.1 xanthine dehydrogenase family protein molybdopterin-binding subunit [Rhizorhabdus sp.]